MKINTQKINEYYIITLDGRLDASWSDFFTDTVFGYIRDGEHKLILHCEKLEFLSSAGIRSLLMITKELAKVKGSFGMYLANAFVSGTIQTTGFGEWLLSEMPVKETFDQSTVPDGAGADSYSLGTDNGFHLSVKSAWIPWEKVDLMSTELISFSRDSFAVGVGSPDNLRGTAQASFGDFLTVCGHVIYQPPEEKSRPDYLLPIKDYQPELRTIQSIVAVGSMQWLYRFYPEGSLRSFPVSALAAKALEMCASDAALLVLMGEIDGLVGANLIQSPAVDGAADRSEFPELRNWLSFSGERVHIGEQALVVGVVAKENDRSSFRLLKKLNKDVPVSGHIHAAVFPYQPLQNGVIDLKQQVDKFFNGPPPKAMMHLIQDDRASVGLGESALVRGAMWCAPIKNVEGQL